MDVSNKFLVILLVITIVITLIGTWYAVDRINKLGFISGADVYGFVNISISNQTNINVTATNCNFGTGYVIAPYTYAVLYSGDNNAMPPCGATPEKFNWSNTTNYNPECMVVRNDGNINLTINVSSGKNTDEFIGGTASTNDYRVWSDSKEQYGDLDSDCSSGTQTFPGVEMTKANVTICNSLQSSNDRDELWVGCYLMVPDNTYGTKGDVLTFWASPAA